MKNYKRERYLSLTQEEKDSVEKSNLDGDHRNVAFLLLLYVLQGIPQGISMAVPILLQNRGVSYADQAEFSIAYFPHSMKLLWAPFVDSVFFKTFGRRKTWICSTQMLAGIFMIFLSYRIDDFMGSEDGIQRPQITILTFLFFMLWCFVSIQDVAVDAWGLTILQPRNVGYAATSNGVGLSAGKFIGFIVFLVFESKEFCNSYIYSEPRNTGLFTLSGFLFFWAIAFVSITTLIALLKHEDMENIKELEEHSDYGLKKAYPILLKIMKLKPVIKLVLMTFTIEACVAVFDIIPLKLIEYGIAKDKFALLTVPSAPLQIFFPLFITKYTTGRKPLSFYYKVFPFRVILLIVTAIFIYMLPMLMENGNLMMELYVGIAILYTLDQVLVRATYAADGSFTTKISDPLVGGTYITLIFTIGNLSKRIFTTAFLWLIDILTWKSCNSHLNTINLSNNTCSSDIQRNICIENGGKCDTIVDGFYVEVVISVVIGIIWFKIIKSVIYKLQRFPKEAWYVLSGKKASTVNNEMHVIKVENVVK